MVAGKYNIRELFLNRYLDQIIIPEIQRDYVWTEEQVNGLFYSILKDYSDYINSETKFPEIISEDGELRNAWKDFYQKRYYSSNIGFIYAYNDEHFSGKYFLIDGQQRITTIYLLLLALASLDKELAKDFTKIYTKNGEGKINYKVRDSTQKFLHRFIDTSLKAKEKIEDQNWYFSSSYINDTSIQSILRNTKNITALLTKENGLNYGEFYHYLENFVQFWYFDTNISEQGEELYIYMNARGEQIQGNENLKADLLGRLNLSTKGEELVRLKNEYGIEWEKWQDYFWTKRNKNENADKGFNEFLSCIAGLKSNMLSPNPKFYSKNKFEEGHKIKTKDLIKTLDLKDVQDYIEALQYLDQNKDEFKALYGYSGWVDKCISEIWKLLNDNSTNWFADYNDANRATERNRMVFLWSILYYTKKHLEHSEKLEESLIVSNIFRFMRMFYLRYKTTIVL